VKNVVLLDVTPLSLGLETMGGVFTKLVERNTTVPTHKAQVFSTAEDMQSAVDVCVFQGERPMARDNKLLGDFRLEGIAAATRGTPQIEVAFDIDANGILNVTAKDLSTGKEQKITITASTNLTKEDVERMVKEAESHAKDDQELRERADVRNEADSTVYSIERQLSELRQKAPSVNASALQLSLDELRAKLKGNADTAQLKNLISEIKGQVQDLERQMAQAAQEAPQQPYAQAGARTGNNGGNGGAHGNSGSDIIDAEVTSSN
jgi:molecular chaperone DnaK